MNFIYFIFFGYLSALLPQYLSIIAVLVANFVVRLVLFRNSKIGYLFLVVDRLVRYPIRYFLWTSCVITGLLIANKYSTGNISYGINIAIIVMFNLMVYYGFLKEFEKQKEALPHDDFRFMDLGNKILFLFILIPVFIFLFKKEWIFPVLKTIFNSTEKYLPFSS